MTIRRLNNHQLSAMTASVSTALSLTTAQQQLTLAQSSSCGSGLSISSGGIKCSRAGHVLIRAQARFDSMTDGNLANLIVKRGSTQLAYASTRSYSRGTMLTLADLVAQVSANDIIYLFAQNASASNGSVAAIASLNYMTVTYLNV